MSEQQFVLAKWLNESALERRYVSVIAAGLLAMMALIATNQRSIFTPWQPGANPFATPSAFFAAPGFLPGGGGRLGRARGPGGLGGGAVPGRAGLPGSPGGGVGGISPAFIDGALPDLPFGDLPGGVPALGGGTPFSGLPTGPTGGGGTVAPLAFIDPAVPESSTWAMMIIGFLTIGIALRRLRRTAFGASALA